MFSPKTVIDDPDAPRPRLARGTQEILHHVSPRDLWYIELRLETLGRNLAVAGGIALGYRLGLAHRDFESYRKGEVPVKDQWEDDHLTVVRRRRPPPIILPAGEEFAEPTLRRGHARRA